MPGLALAAAKRSPRHLPSPSPDIKGVSFFRSVHKLIRAAFARDASGGRNCFWKTLFYQDYIRAYKRQPLPKVTAKWAQLRFRKGWLDIFIVCRVMVAGEALQEKILLVVFPSTKKRCPSARVECKAATWQRGAS